MGDTPHVGTPDPTSPRVRDAEGNVIERETTDRSHVVTTDDVQTSGVKGRDNLPKSAADSPSESRVKGT